MCRVRGQDVGSFRLLAYQIGISIRHVNPGKTNRAGIPMSGTLYIVATPIGNLARLVFPGLTCRIDMPICAIRSARPSPDSDDKVLLRPPPGVSHALSANSISKSTKVLASVPRSRAGCGELSTTRISNRHINSTCQSGKNQSRRNTHERHVVHCGNAHRQSR